LFKHFKNGGREAYRRAFRTKSPPRIKKHVPGSAGKQLSIVDQDPGSYLLATALVRQPVALSFFL